LRLAMAGVGRPSAAEWDLGAWDVPVVRRDADVSRPVVQRGLTAYTATTHKPNFTIGEIFACKVGKLDK